MDEITQLLSFLFSFLFGFGFHILTIWHFKLTDTYATFLRYITTILFVLNIVLLYVYIMYQLNDGVLHPYFLAFVFFGFLMYSLVKKYVKFPKIRSVKVEKFFR